MLLVKKIPLPPRNHSTFFAFVKTKPWTFKWPPSSGTTTPSQQREPIRIRFSPTNNNNNNNNGARGGRKKSSRGSVLARWTERGVVEKLSRVARTRQKGVEPRQRRPSPTFLINASTLLIELSSSLSLRLLFRPFRKRNLENNGSPPLLETSTREY